MSDGTGGEALPPKNSWLSRVTSRPTRMASPSLIWGAAVARVSNELNMTWDNMICRGRRSLSKPPIEFIRIVRASAGEDLGP